MWAHYGGNHKDFVVGFHTVELARTLLCSIGPVKYSDDIPFYSFLTPDSDADFETYFLKSKKWEYEKEFRFFSISDDINFDRIKKYSVKSVAEFLLGASFPEQDKDEFIKEVNKIFSKQVPIYQTKPKVSGFGFEKHLIS
jgi:hypothetical protein